MFEPSLATELRDKIEEVFPPERVVPAHTEHEHYYKDSYDEEVYPSVTTKTSLLSRKYYKQLAANKAVDHIQEYLINNREAEPEDIARVLQEARNKHVEDLDLAGMWGTHGHDMVDEYVRTWIETKERPKDIMVFAKSDTSPEGKCAALGAMKFFDDYTVFPIASEKKIISKKHRYGGTLDSLWLVGEPYKNRDGDKDCDHLWSETGKHSVACMKCNRKCKLFILLGDWKTSNAIFGYGQMGKYDYAMQVSAYAMALKEMAKITCQKHWIIRLDKYKPFYEVGTITNIKKAGKAFLAMNMVSEFARSSEAPVDKLEKRTVITL